MKKIAIKLAACMGLFSSALVPNTFVGAKTTVRPPSISLVNASLHGEAFVFVENDEKNNKDPNCCGTIILRRYSTDIIDLLNSYSAVHCEKDMCGFEKNPDKYVWLCYGDAGDKEEYSSTKKEKIMGFDDLVTKNFWNDLEGMGGKKISEATVTVR